MQTDHSRLGWSLALLALAQLIFSLDINIVFVALPEIGADLGFSEQTLQWVVSAYVVFAGGFLLLGGRAADLLGRRRMFVTALALYGIASLAGGLATSAEVIVLARALQGIGAALLLPSTLSLINTLFEEGPRRNRALAAWSGAGASGLSLGALLGGVLTQAFGWSAVFFVNVPLAALVAIAALAVIPRDAPRSESRRFDLPGALTATAGATLLIYALVQAPEVGWAATEIVIAAVLGGAMLTAFTMIEARSADPLMPLRLLRNRSLVSATTFTFVFMGTFGALPYFLTVLFQTVHGFTALETGLAFLAPSVTIAIGTQVGERLTTHLGMRKTLLVGCVVGAGGTAILAAGFDSSGTYLSVVPGLLIGGMGQGIIWTAMWIATAAGVAEREQGVASGMASTTLNLGNAVGLAILVAIANSGIDARSGDQLRSSIADGSRTAVLVAAAGILLAALITLALPGRSTAKAHADGLASVPAD